MADLSEQERHILLHALGLNRERTPYRNRFVTGPGTIEYPVCRFLVARGLMAERPGSEITGGDSVFFVTESGKEAVARCAAGLV
jgi:hypothetical protein